MILRHHDRYFLRERLGEFQFRKKCAVRRRFSAGVPIPCFERGNELTILKSGPLGRDRGYHGKIIRQSGEKHGGKERRNGEDGEFDHGVRFRVLDFEHPLRSPCHREATLGKP